MAFSLKIQEEVSNQLKKLGNSTPWKIPRRGWVRTMRTALGMSSRQLAAHIGVKPPRVFEIEKDELRGVVTLNTMKRVAESMGCDFVYAFMPKNGETIEGLMIERAEEILKGKFSVVEHTMALEQQAVKTDSTNAQRSEAIKNLVAKPPRWFWDAK
jgi:predicted DNA-binding mobile mystery protein A